MLERMFEERFALKLIFKVYKVSKSLNPEIGVLLCAVLLVLVLLVNSFGHAWFPAPLKDLLRGVVMNVESEELLT